ncbi:fumarate hydratase C-terminal domain-containing protein [Rhizobium sp. FY34]|uniref:fumarate hydratase C-terminal domain-containing protein n=1 Tax=Rhizobium sp. FY34 TaxID=2562309 RepID=UPI0010C03F33|nr:fumarate hydratase C-terminal domain-containing protein [Rhizobium sp. FY34]
MSHDYDLSLPVDPADLALLKPGDRVYLTGEITSTAGLPTHERLVRELAEGILPPVKLAGGVLFHLGSSLEEIDGRWHLHYVNPTTSTRFNALMPPLIRGYGLRLTGGKGGLSHESAEALAESGGVYLSFPGGAAPVLTDAVEEVVEVAWPEMISHYRIVRMRVKRLGPLTVGIDTHGNSVYDQIDETAKGRRAEILAQLVRDRAGV